MSVWLFQNQISLYWILPGHFIHWRMFLLLYAYSNCGYPVFYSSFTCVLNLSERNSSSYFVSVCFYSLLKYFTKFGRYDVLCYTGQASLYQYFLLQMLSDFIHFLWNSLWNAMKSIIHILSWTYGLLIYPSAVTSFSFFFLPFLLNASLVPSVLK